MNVLTEQHLQNYTTCPYLIQLPAERTMSEQIVRPVLQAALVATFNKELLPLKTIRDRLEQNIGTSSTHTWKKFPLGLARAAARISNLTLKYTVLQPLTPYTLNLGQTVIQGEYALIKSPNRKLPSILHPWYGAATVFSPSLENFARYVHYCRNHSSLPCPGNFHFQVMGSANSAPKQRMYDFSVAMAALESVSRATLDAPYPRPGLHCIQCDSTPCLGNSQ